MLRHSHGSKHRPFPIDNQNTPGHREYRVGTGQLVMKRGMLPVHDSIYPDQYQAHNNIRPGIEGGNKQRSAPGRTRHENI